MQDVYMLIHSQHKLFRCGVHRLRDVGMNVRLHDDFKVHLCLGGDVKSDAAKLRAMTVVDLDAFKPPISSTGGEDG
jgi:hypothetical protein